MYNFDPVRFYFTTCLVWIVALKKTEIDLKLRSNIEIYLMVASEIKVGICHSVLLCAKVNNKYMNDCNENKNASYLY